MNNIYKFIFLVGVLYFTTFSSFSQININNNEEYVFTSSDPGLGIPMNIIFEQTTPTSEIADYIGVRFLDRIEVEIDSSTDFVYSGGAIVDNTLTFRCKVYIFRRVYSRTGEMSIVKEALEDYGDGVPVYPGTFDSFQIGLGSIGFFRGFGGYVIRYNIVVKERVRTVTEGGTIPRTGRGG